MNTYKIIKCIRKADTSAHCVVWEGTFDPSGKHQDEVERVDQFDGFYIKYDKAHIGPRLTYGDIIQHLPEVESELEMEEWLALMAKSDIEDMTRENEEFWSHIIAPVSDGGHGMVAPVEIVDKLKSKKLKRAKRPQ